MSPTLIAEIIGGLATIVGGIYGLTKLAAYYATKSTQQKIDAQNQKDDQALDKFEQTGRPQ